MRRAALIWGCRARAELRAVLTMGLKLLPAEGRNES
jgi:hypothetical protein